MLSQILSIYINHEKEITQLIDRNQVFFIDLSKYDDDLIRIADDWRALPTSLVVLGSRQGKENRLGIVKKRVFENCILANEFLELLVSNSNEQQSNDQGQESDL